MAQICCTSHFFLLLLLLLAKPFGASSGILIDDFSGTLDSNLLGGVAGDDGTCSGALTPTGLSLSGASGCYYYSLLAPSGCYSIPSSITHVRISLSSPPPSWSFSLTLQIKTPDCLWRDTTTSFTTSSNNSWDQITLGAVTTLSIPLSLFEGAPMDRVHAFVLTELSVPLTIRTMELVSLSSAPTPSPTPSPSILSSLLIDDFSGSVTSNLLGGVSGDDGTCSQSKTSGGLSLVGGTGCYYYSVFVVTGCYPVPPTSYLKITLTSPPPTWSFALQWQLKTSNCTTRDPTSFTLSLTSYTPTLSSGGDVASVLVPMSDIVARGADLTRSHALVLTRVTTSITLNRLELVTLGSPSTTEAPTTEAPTTEAPTTEAPTTEAPTTQAPTTEAPTEAPTTAAP